MNLGEEENGIGEASTDRHGGGFVLHEHREIFLSNGICDPPVGQVRETVNAPMKRKKKKFLKKKQSNRR